MLPALCSVQSALVLPLHFTQVAPSTILVESVIASLTGASILALPAIGHRALLTGSLLFLGRSVVVPDLTTAIYTLTCWRKIVGRDALCTSLSCRLWIGTLLAVLRVALPFDTVRATQDVSWITLRACSMFIA